MNYLGRPDNHKRKVVLVTALTEGYMVVVTLVKIISNLLKLIAMGVFTYYAYEGTFRSGGSMSVFIGVTILAAVIVISQVIDELSSS